MRGMGMVCIYVSLLKLNDFILLIYKKKILNRHFGRCVRTVRFYTYINIIIYIISKNVKNNLK